MTENDALEQVAVMRSKLDEKKSAARTQFSTSADGIRNSTVTAGSSPMELRDLLNKLRLNMRSDEPV